MNTTESCMKFPCSFPLKAMGLNTAEFGAAVHEICNRHLNAAAITYSEKISSGNKYLSITVTFVAESREQIDRLYEELNSHELVLMTL